MLPPLGGPTPVTKSNSFLLACEEDYYCFKNHHSDSSRYELLGFNPKAIIYPHKLIKKSYPLL